MTIYYTDRIGFFKITKEGIIMLYKEAFLSMNNFMEYLHSYDLNHMCAETTLYSGSEDLAGISNKETGLLNSKNSPILIKHSIHQIKEFADDYFKLYQKLSDEESKDTLFELLKYRMTLDETFLINAYSFQTPYFDTDILPSNTETVYVDYSDSVIMSIYDFIGEFPDYQKIHIFAATKNYYNDCLKELSEIEHTSIIFSSLGEQKISIKVPNPFQPNRTDEIHMDRLDSILSDKISLLRIDSGTQGQSVLKGSIKHIQQDKPTIAICVGNMIDDLLQVPTLLEQLNTNYHFYLRHYSTSDIKSSVLYAV